jgi:hypothetical protein
MKVRMLVFGHPGSWKTSFLATAAAAGLKVLFIRSPMDHFPVRALKCGAEQWVITDWPQMDDCLRYLRSDGKDWDWVIMDSATLLKDQLLQSIWDDVKLEKPHRSGRGIASVPRTSTSP